MTFREKQAELVERVNGLGDCFDQYAYLISQAAELPAMPKNLHTEKNWSRAASPGFGSMYPRAPTGRFCSRRTVIR